MSHLRRGGNRSAIMQKASSTCAKLQSNCAFQDRRQYDQGHTLAAVAR